MLRNNLELPQEDPQDIDNADTSHAPYIPKVDSPTDRNLLNNLDDVGEEKSESKADTTMTDAASLLLTQKHMAFLLFLFFLFPTGMAAPKTATSHSESAFRYGSNVCLTLPENRTMPIISRPPAGSNHFCFPLMHRTELYHPTSLAGTQPGVCYRKMGVYYHPPFIDPGCCSAMLPNSVTESVTPCTICPTDWVCFQDVHRTELFRFTRDSCSKSKKKRRPTEKKYHPIQANQFDLTYQPGPGMSLTFFLALLPNLIASLIVCRVVAHRYPLDTAAGIEQAIAHRYPLDAAVGIEQATLVYITPSPSTIWTLRRFEDSRPHPLLEITSPQDIDHEGIAEIGSTPHVDSTLPTIAHVSLLAQGRREGALTGGQNGGMVVDLTTPTDLRLEEMVTGRQVRQSQVEVETDPIVVSAPAGIVITLDCQGSILKKDERSGDMDHGKSHVYMEIAERDGNMDHVTSHSSMEVDELFNTGTGTAIKVSTGGHKATSSYIYIKPGVRQVGVVSCLYLPNPPPNTTQVEHHHTADTTVTEVGIGILLENGLFANVCVEESAGVEEDLEFLPPLAEDEVNDHPQLVDEQVALFNNSEHNLRPFLGSYGPQDD